MSNKEILKHSMQYKEVGTANDTAQATLGVCTPKNILDIRRLPHTAICWLFMDVDLKGYSVCMALLNRGTDRDDLKEPKQAC